MMDWLIILVAAYLLGSISGSMVIGGIRKVDIRTMGSGNAGGTNALRTQGTLFALGVIVIDVGKGAIAAGLLPGLLPIASEVAPDRLVAATACGFMAVVGHVWPVYFRFRGGKGAGTAAGVIVVLAPLAALPLMGAWILVILLTGYVGLATVVAAILFLPAFWMLGPQPMPAALMVFALALTGLLVFTHRSNIRRLLRGEESRFERARVFRKRP